MQAALAEAELNADTRAAPDTDAEGSNWRQRRSVCGVIIGTDDPTNRKADPLQRVQLKKKKKPSERSRESLLLRIK